MASSMIQKNVTGGANPIILVSPSDSRQFVQVTCAFGASTVRISTTNPSGGSPLNWFMLPAAQFFPWELDSGEGLWVYADATTTVSVAVKDVP